MRHRLSAVLLVLCACVPGRAAPPGSPGRTVRDARGAAVTVPGTPRRIVSLAPAATEMLFALGLGRDVVGDTVYCNYPPAARTITKIGDVNTAIEAVVALHPDLIVATDGNKSAAARLGQLRQPVFVIAPTSFAATERSLALLGQATGAQRQAQAVVGRMEAERRAAERVAALDAGHRPRVLVVIGLHPLWTAGAGTFVNDVLVRAGGINVAAFVNQYAPFSRERLFAAPPDVILADPQEAAAMRADPVLGRLGAVREGHFFSINPDILLRPGPRLADALLQMARALHPGVK